ncbi:SufE family protein [Alcaligenes parafaecalis]|uniref:SufE family protein n=1 Tax=Alcaligenes parafaecalis TaxID=171260 RepID=A0ABT3VKE3_9BURK|nr:SufE family protein [Alcaligenes parafaecalis]MCX5462959.1 SufE family protein [Alcaligenes parafaecalis]
MSVVTRGIRAGTTRFLLLVIGAGNRPSKQEVTVDKDSAPESIAQTQQSIVDGFHCLGNWMARYEYLIDLGRSLSDFPDKWRTEANRLHGCQAQVWMVSELRDHRLFFQARSDSAIVTGLLALLMKVYSGRLPEEILSHPPEFLRVIELDQHLSPNRANGLFHMMERVRLAAQGAMDAEVAKAKP